MKHLQFYCLAIILTALFACEPPITFDAPQPVDVDNLTKFPKRLKGKFISLADSSFLLITDNLIVREHHFNQKIHPSQLDSTCILNGDTIFNIVSNSKEIVVRDGDSLITHVHYSDTIFEMNNDHVLRKYKGHYFLNTRYDNESWEVRKMDLSKGKLTVSSIASKEEIEKLEEITASIQDTVAPYKFNLTKKQFKEFIKSEGFSESEEFVKVN